MKTKNLTGQQDPLVVAAVGFQSRVYGDRGLSLKAVIAVFLFILPLPVWAGRPLDNDWRCNPAPNPDMTYILKPNTLFTSLGVPFETNEYGFRDRTVFEKTPGVFRVVCLGDSITFGTGVPNEQTYPNVLEKELQQMARPGYTIDVINAGISAYNIRNIRGLLQEYIDDLKPDVVTYAFVENDLDDSVSVGPDGLLMAYDPAKGPDEPFIADDYPAVWLARYESIHRKGFLKRLSSLFDNQMSLATDTPPPLLIGDHPITRKRWSFFRAELQKMKEICDANGVPLLVYSFGLSQHSEPVVKRVFESCREVGLPHASTLPVFHKADYMKKYSLGYDPHLNPLGHIVMSSRLLCYLLDQGVLSQQVFALPPNHSHYVEVLDPQVTRSLEEESLSAPRFIDLERGKGVLGMIGGISVDGKMARWCVVRLSGPGEWIEVTASALFATPEQPQMLSAEIEGVPSGNPIMVPNSSAKIRFRVPQSLYGKTVEVKLYATGPVWVPTPEQRFRGATAQTIQLQRIERVSGEEDSRS